METLTAFVRERARWEEPEPSAPEMAAQSDLWQSGSRSDQARQQRPTPATDIAAVLQVLRRRPDAGREREKLRDWRLDLRMTDLRGADLSEAHLEGAILSRGASRRRQPQRGASRRRHPQRGASRTRQPPRGASRRRRPRRGASRRRRPPSGRISKAPTSPRRISKAPTSAGRSATPKPGCRTASRGRPTGRPMRRSPRGPVSPAATGAKFVADPRAVSPLIWGRRGGKRLRRRSVPRPRA